MERSLAVDRPALDDNSLLEETPRLLNMSHLLPDTSAKEKEHTVHRGFGEKRDESMVETEMACLGDLGGRLSNNIKDMDMNASRQRDSKEELAEYEK